MNGRKARWLRRVSYSVTRLTPDVDGRGMYRYLKRQYRTGDMTNVDRAVVAADSLRKLGI